MRRRATDERARSGSFSTESRQTLNRFPTSAPPLPSPSQYWPTHAATRRRIGVYQCFDGNGRLNTQLGANDIVLGITRGGLQCSSALKSVPAESRPLRRDTLRLTVVRTRGSHRIVSVRSTRRRDAYLKRSSTATASSASASIPLCYG